MNTQLKNAVKYDLGSTYGFGSYGFEYNFTPQSGSVRVSVLALEAGRVFPIGVNGSNFYLTIGLAVLDHKGQAPSADDLLGYEDGQRGGIKMDAGFAVHFSPHVGLNFSLGFTVMQVHITYTNLNNYSEDKFYGTLYKLGTGLFFLL